MTVPFSNAHEMILMARRNLSHDNWDMGRKGDL